MERVDGNTRIHTREMEKIKVLRLKETGRVVMLKVLQNINQSQSTKVRLNVIIVTSSVIIAQNVVQI